MEDAVRTMITNLEKNSGKSLDAWVKLAQAGGAPTFGAIRDGLKADHGLGHGYANLVARTTLERAQAHVPVGDELIDAQYAKKPALRPLYDAVVALLDVEFEIIPKKTAVAFKRSKQFAYLQPSTKTRLDVGVQLKGEPATARLTARSGMTSHVVAVTSLEDVDEELGAWLRLAWERC